MPRSAGLRKTLQDARMAISMARAQRESGVPKDPVEWAAMALRLELDDWQAEIMRSTDPNLVVIAARQSGKSVITGAKAAYEAQASPGLRVVVTAPSFRQAGLLADKIENALSGSGIVCTRVREKLTLPNGSTVIVLHGDRAPTLRGHTADLLLCDEIGFIKPELMPAILPMIAASQGRLVAISSPNGPTGPLYDLAHQDGVKVMKVAASDVAHFDPKVIEELRGRLGPALARQELDAEFVASSTSVFSADILEAMFSSADSLMGGEEDSLADEELANAERDQASKLVEWYGSDDRAQASRINDMKARFNL